MKLADLKNGEWYAVMSGGTHHYGKPVLPSEVVRMQYRAGIAPSPRAAMRLVETEDRFRFVPLNEIRAQWDDYERDTLRPWREEQAHRQELLEQWQIMRDQPLTDARSYLEHKHGLHGCDIGFRYKSYGWMKEHPWGDSLSRVMDPTTNPILVTINFDDLHAWIEERVLKKELNGNQLDN